MNARLVFKDDEWTLMIQRNSGEWHAHGTYTTRERAIEVALALKPEVVQIRSAEIVELRP